MIALSVHWARALIPQNDNFATRAPLTNTGASYVATGSNVEATMEVGEPDPAFLLSKSVWWTWVAPSNAYMTLTVTGNFNTIVTLYTGDSISNLAFVAFNDWDPFSDSSDPSRIEVNVTAGTAYQIAVDGYLGESGNIFLRLILEAEETPPANDNFEDRIVITGSHFNNVNGSNIGATKEPGEPFHADALGGKSIWWSWTAPASGGVTITTAGSVIDTVVGVYTGNSVANLVFVAGNDENPLSSAGLESRVVFNATAGTTYQIAVDGYDGDSGPTRFRLDLDLPFAVSGNDNFANRSNIVGSSATVVGTNIAATLELNEPLHLATFGGKSLWWTWTAPSSGRATFTTAGSTVDTIVAVYTGNSLANLQFVAGNDENGFTLAEGDSAAIFNATSGTTYQIAVDGYDSDSGSITLQLAMTVADPVPANNNFANATPINGTNTTVTGSNRGATLEANEPLHNDVYGGKSVWWRWTSPGPGFVTVDTIGSICDTLLGVYTGSSVSDLTEMASDDETAGNGASLVTFTTKSDVTYYIAVDGFDGDFGNITLRLRYTRRSFTLMATTNPPAGGSVTIEPPPDEDGKYAPGSVVMLAASAAPGLSFTNWTGAFASTNNPLWVTMSTNLTFTANFVPPSLSCPPNVTVQCPGNTSPAATGMATYNGTCGDVEITFSDSEAPGCGNTRVITRTWQATDDCGTMATCTQTITVVDTTRPSITCPPNATVPCGGDTSPAATGMATGSDTCGNVSISFTDTQAAGCANTMVITRIWKATDVCNNMTTCTQRVSVVDMVAPMITCPSNATVSCNGDTSPATTGMASASDNCGAVTITFSDTQVNGCGDTKVITRTWKATDACSNMTTCVQTITVADMVRPMINCPPNTTVQCGADTSPAGTGMATANDNCGSVTITFSDAEEVDCGNAKVITRTWKATDPCDNMRTCTQTITVVDATPPTINCPANATVQCGGDTSPAATGMATANDACGNVTITFTDTQAARCGNTWVITRTWKATDGCTNMVTCAQTITVVDPTPPTINCPTNVTVACGQDTSPAATGMATASDACGNVTITFSDTQMAKCGNTRVITRTWKATDACTNMATCQQTITVVDTNPPTINCPPNATVQCGGDISPSGTGMATASDACGSVMISFSDSEVTGCGVITRTWKAKDDCQNMATCVQTITLVDTTPPTITCPTNVVVPCGSDTSPSATGMATGADACGNVTITFTDTQTAGCGNTRVITRTWKAADGCSNMVTCAQTIRVVDTTAPTINCPTNVTVACGVDTSPAATGMATASDSCGNAMVTFSDVETPGCGNTRIITRTWKGTDACTNMATCVQTISVVDSLPPSITCPPNATVPCGGDTSPAATGMATASDSCENAMVTFSDVEAPGCGNTRIITRTWKATDACTNMATCVQTISVVDSIPPSITCPTNITVQCGGDTSPAATGMATANDNCGNVAVTFTDSETPGCGNTKVITRTWKATDACTNMATCVQTISVVDSTPPSIMCPPNATVPCGGDASPAATGMATASDSCGNATVTFTDVETPGCGNTRVITRTWRATDACTNMATCVQTISVVDSAPPSITCPTNITVQCGGDTSPAAAGMATASDNCGNVTITFNDSEPAACGKVITRTWTATDACGNTAMCAQTVTVVDATPPRLMVFYPQNHASLQTDGFRFFLIAPTNVSYVIERSTNLTDWTEFQTLQLITNQTLIGDSGASSVPWRFYRARRVQ